MELYIHAVQLCKLFFLENILGRLSGAVMVKKEFRSCNLLLGFGCSGREKNLSSTLPKRDSTKESLFHNMILLAKICLLCFKHRFINKVVKTTNLSVQAFLHVVFYVPINKPVQLIAISGIISVRGI